MTDIYDARVVVVYVCISAVVLGFVLFFLLRCMAGCITWSLILLYLILLLILISWLHSQSESGGNIFKLIKESFDSLHSGDDTNTTTNTFVETSVGL